MQPTRFVLLRERLMRNVEAVEKVPAECFRFVDGKMDLPECARFDASTRGRGKRTPKSPIRGSGTFSTASLGATS